MIDKFEPYVKARFGDDIYRCGFEADALIVRDHTNFKIGPHTDAPHRLLSMLFYCPDDASLSHLGTSLYVPRERGFVLRPGARRNDRECERCLSQHSHIAAPFCFGVRLGLRLDRLR